MDSVTQIALGAAVGELVLGRRIGNKALLVGAIVGSLPDIDIFLPLGGAVESFTYHRSFSHSLLVLTLLSPFIAVLLHRTLSHKILATLDVSFSRWWLMAWLALVTHPLLDSFTVYGTQLFWPITDYPVSGSSIFIIDPAYTLILIGGLFCASRRTIKGHYLNTVALVVSSFYLAWSMIAKNVVHTAVAKSLQQQSISYKRLLTTPTPLNTIGWRFVAMQEDGYRTGYYSLLDPAEQPLETYRYESDESLLASIAGHWPVQRLKYFTHGFYKVQQVGNEIQMVDLRMGIEKSYIFAFTVGEASSDEGASTEVRAVENREATNDRDFSKMKDVMRRVFDPSINLEQR